MSEEVQTVMPASVPAMYRGEDWNTLVAESRHVFGADLEKGDLLIGVPMCLIMATYRRGDYVDRTGTKGYYVSLDAITGDEEEFGKAIRRKRIPEENLGLVGPGEHLVFNEGGTGVYRQITAFLEETGRIKITSELPKEGAYGDTRYDVSPAEWDVDDSAELKHDEESGSLALAFSIRLLCPRGLRSSDYANEWSKQARTRYLG